MGNSTNSSSPLNYTYTSSTDGQSTDLSKDVSGESAPINIPSRLDAIREMKKQLLIEEGEMIEKGLTSNDPDVLMKANKHWEDVKERNDSGIKSTVIDPHEFRDSLGYKHKNTSMTYDVLRRMAETPLIKAVISTRQAQVAEFSYPQANKFEPGFVIKKKQKHFAEDQEEVTDKDRTKMHEIAEFLINGGEDGNAWDGDTFDMFLKKIVEDSLTLDQATFEVVRNNFGVPVEFLATDGATFRIADTYEQEKAENSMEREEVKGYLPKYVQIIEGEMVNEYYPWDLCFGIRNATTNIIANGYGRSELEVLIQIVTWMLYSDTYNGNFFSQGASPKGFLKVSGNVNSNRIQEFRQQWMSMTAGVANAWKTPIIESEKMEWIDLQQKNTDMQFSEWQEYLLRVVCAVYKISPDELGFNIGSSGSNNSMMEGSNESKIKYSKDKGLRPLLKSIEFWINKWVINAIDGDYEFRFVGMDTESEEKQLELDLKRAATFMGLKEVRRKNDLPDELEEGDMILNPVWQQASAMAAMAGDQEESTGAAEAEGGGVWDSVDGEDDSFEFEEADDTAEKGVESNPFLNDLNTFAKGLMDEK